MGNSTAAMLVIGDEILSGRTQDVNIAHIATKLAGFGIELCEARVVSDQHEAIVSAINALRKAYDLVFTSGGIGPTHDDITTDAVAAAFGVEVIVDDRALELVTRQIVKHGLELNEARKRMARIPAGATLIMNSVSGAPGYAIGNVNVMAGVPAIFRDMLRARLSELPSGQQSVSVTVDVQLPEGTIASSLARIASSYPSLSIGSYPYYTKKRFGSQVVVRGFELQDVDSAATEVEDTFGENARRMEDCG